MAWAQEVFMFQEIWSAPVAGMNCSIPVFTTCSGVEIGPKKIRGHSEKIDVPAINLSLNIGIPVKELLAALSTFQLPSLEPSPAPVDVPDCSLQSKKARKPPEKGHETSSGSRWESVPQHVGPRVVLGGADVTTPGQPYPSSMSRGLTVKVSNISRRVRPDELQQVFEQQVGPVLDVSVVDDTARLTFFNHESAQKAVDEFDGGILEASKSEGSQMSPSLTLHPRSSSSSLLEERLGPLSSCHLRRGEGWMTIFRAAITKQLKKDRQLATSCFARYEP